MSVAQAIQEIIASASTEQRRVLIAVLDAKTFCPTGPGGGVDPNCGGAGGGSGVAEIGVHIKKVSGKTEESTHLLNEVGAVDKTFGGGLLTFLAKNPIKTLNIGSTGNSATGAYNDHLQKLVIRPEKFHSPVIFDKDDTIAVAYGQKHGDSNKETQKATFVHELGHHVANMLEREYPDFRRDVLVKSYMSEKKYPSKYAATHFEEYFAESFSAYHFDPRLLSSKAKKMVDTAMKLVRGS